MNPAYGPIKDEVKALLSSHTLFSEVDISALPKGSWVVEVGSQREPQPADSDANSSCWLLGMAEDNGLRFVTVDFSRDTFECARSYVGDKAVLGDGAQFIRDFGKPISVLYLDNFDVVYNDKHKESLMRRVGTAYDEHQEEITNERSAAVHLEQLEAALPLLTSPAYVGIDDTLIRDGAWWGKGARVVPFLLELGFEIVAEGPEGLVLKKPGETD